MASLEELGLEGKIEPYTGIPSVDWVLNHHMTPLFVLFVCTAVFRYLYSAGLIFPLEESEINDTNNNTSANNTSHIQKKNSKKSKSSSKIKNDDFLFGISCVPSKNKDKLSKQQSTIMSIKKVKGVKVVMNPSINESNLQAVYVSMDDSKQCYEKIEIFLKAKIHVLVDCPMTIMFNNESNSSRSGSKSGGGGGGFSGGGNIISRLNAIAKKNNVYLLQMTPSRFAASWERMFSSVHAEAGTIESIHMEYETGPMPRCMEKVWNCFCRCTCCCCGPCVQQSGYKRSRATATPRLVDAAMEGMSILHELLKDITNKSELLNTKDGNQCNEKIINESNLCITGHYDSIKWTYSCKVNSWKCIFPKAFINVLGSESNVVYKYYDSIDGNQIVQVNSKYGFSHTDRVSDVYDGWTVSIVTFVRAIKFKENITNMLESSEEALKLLYNVGVLSELKKER
jgi:hypothetical protein